MEENGEKLDLTHFIFATDLEKDPHYSSLESEAQEIANDHAAKFE